MNDVFVQTATEVRKNWSTVADTAIREKPQFIKKTRDYMMLSDIKLIEFLLDVYTFTADKFIEDDGSITLSLNELDLVENAPTEYEAKLALGRAILEYAEDFYQEFNIWSAAPNRKPHVPYVLKALLFDNSKRIGDSIECQNGKS